jgi:hypothetical protein
LGDAGGDAAEVEGVIALGREAGALAADQGAKADCSPVALGLARAPQRPPVPHWSKTSF